MNAQQLKASITVENYLLRIGFDIMKPKNGDGPNLYFLSPNGEKTASLHVSRPKNVWFDHSCGRGGNLIDMACYVLECDGKPHSIKDAIYHLNQLYSGVSFPKVEIKRHYREPDKPINEFRKIEGFFMSGQLELLQERKITMEIANKYLENVSFYSNKYQKVFYGLGFKNIAGGWEVRNKFKTSIGKKDISIVPGVDTSVVEVWESWRDFLPYLSALYPSDSKAPNTAIILNSLSFTSKAHDLIARRLSLFNNNIKEVRTFLHNDERKSIDKLTASERSTNYMLTLDCPVFPMNFYYRDFNDPGDYFKVFNP